MDLANYIFYFVQTKLISSHQKQDNVIETNRMSSNGIFILCKDCSEVLCQASELRYREPSYICASENFEKKIKVDYTAARFYCRNKSCERELGKTLIFAKGKKREAFIVDIKGVKFIFHGKTIESYSKWSKIPFNVTEYDC
jgi:hypothetical protein